MMLRSVLLPQPEWPTIVTNSTLLDLEAHVPETHTSPPPSVAEDFVT